MKKNAVFISALIILSSGCTSLKKNGVGQQFQDKYLSKSEIGVPNTLFYQWGTLTITNYAEKDTNKMTVNGEFKIDKGREVWDPTLEYLLVDKNRTEIDSVYIASKSGQINKQFKFTKLFPYYSNSKYYQIILRCRYA